MANDVRNFVLDKGYDAAAAITKYRAVKFSADQVVTPVSAVGDIPIGVAQDGVTTAEIAKGKGCPVAVLGITAFEADAACAAGDRLVIGASANGTLAPSGTASAGTNVIGVCVLSAAGQGKRGSMRLTL